MGALKLISFFLIFLFLLVRLGENVEIINLAAVFFVICLFWVAVDRLLGTITAGLNCSIVKKRNTLLQRISAVRKEFYAKGGVNAMPINNYAVFVEEMEHIGLDADLLMKQLRKDTADGLIIPEAELIPADAHKKRIFSSISGNWVDHFVRRIIPERLVLAEVERCLNCNDWTGIEMIKFPKKPVIKIVVKGE